jgi:hypothetical protein
MADSPTNTDQESRDYAPTRARLLELLEKRSGSEATSWLETEHQRLSSSLKTVDDRDLISQLISSLGETLLETRRRFSKRYLVAAFAERDRAWIATPRGEMPIGHWKSDEAAKLWLIATLIDDHFDHDHTYTALYQLYDASDTEGRVVCLRALNALDGSSEAGLKIVHDAGRTYLNELMEAAWCHSPFASQSMSVEEHRKAVLKSLFCDVAVSGFMGLEERADAELSRRLCEYADEREAAGRVVPASVLRVASFYPQPGLIACLIGRLEHPSAEERLTAAIGLERASDSRALSFIEERLTREPDPEIHAALMSARQKLASGGDSQTS